MTAGLSQEITVILEKQFHNLSQFIETHLREKLSARKFEAKYVAWLASQSLKFDEETIILGASQLTFFLLDVLLFSPSKITLECDSLEVHPILDVLCENFPSDLTHDIFNSFFRNTRFLTLLDACWSQINGFKKKLPGSLLGTFYEKLIPSKIRRRWGQVYTAPEIAQLIAEWCVQSPLSRVLDPAFGTGRILRAIYERLAHLREPPLLSDESHKTILSQIFGCERNKVAAQIAQFSLGRQEKCENLIEQDFFEYSPSIEFDAILMNPPYTKHEHLNFEVQGQNYKQFVRTVSLN
ncbi:MAG: N-6 DNA methylase, partial [Candidatus Hodarchaeota archaeon]